MAEGCSSIPFTSSLSAFSFSKLKFRGKNGIFLGLLATMMIPFAVVMIPQSQHHVDQRKDHDNRT